MTNKMCRVLAVIAFCFGVALIATAIILWIRGGNGRIPSAVAIGGSGWFIVSGLLSRIANKNLAAKL